MDRVPSAFEKNASCLDASYAAPSTPAPMGSVVTIDPVATFEIAATPLRQPLNRRPLATSIAIDTGCRHGAVDQRRVTARVRVSISTTSLVSVRFTYTLPLPADTPDSGFPPSGTLRMNAPVRASSTVALCASPLNENTRFDGSS